MLLTELPSKQQQLAEKLSAQKHGQSRQHGRLQWHSISAELVSPGHQQQPAGGVASTNTAA